MQQFQCHHIFILLVEIKIIRLLQEVVLGSMNDKINCNKFLVSIILLQMQTVFYGRKSGFINLEE